MELGKFIVVDALQKGDYVSNKKIQKLLYYIQAWFLAIRRRPILEEDFEAWVMGPVCRPVYDEFKHFGYQPVMLEEIKDMDEEDLQQYKIRIVLDAGLQEEEVELIEDVLAKYGRLSAFDLQNLTHSERPWIEARRGLLPHQNSKRNICRTTMQEFYSAML